MTKAGERITADRAREGRTPFYGRVEDVFMIDKTRAQLFTSLGRTPALFRGLATWPSLERAFAGRSAGYLRDAGAELWEKAGGVRGPDGAPTCLPTSPLAADVVRDIASDPGGLLWTDPAGVVWAVRLVPAGGRDGGAYFGFAISWPGGGTLPGAGAATPSARPGAGQSRTVRRSLERTARALRLSARAEQLLWTIHWAVVTQRRSVVLLPDELLGQVVWGGDRRGWPQDWRRDVFQTLRSLMSLRSEVLRLSAEGWRPQLGADSVAVATVEQLWVTRPAENYCRPACPMWGTHAAHDHFAVQAGYGFLGVMEKFATAESPDCRLYDFKATPADEAGEEVRRARGEGRLVSVGGPAALFGRAKWAGLTAEQETLLRGLVGEITRPVPPRKSDRSDGALVLCGARVPARRPGKTTVPCPYLRPGARYVAFCGNGMRRGMGYLIAGHGGRGWLDKCGYPVPDDERELAAVIRLFLSDLLAVSGVLGLVPVGVGPGAEEWIDMQGLLTLARGPLSALRLLSYHLRVYGPEDYLGRWRGYYERTGSFASIPGGDAGADGPGTQAGPADLSTRVRLAGIRQVELAERLGVRQPYVCQILNGKRPWPERAREQAELLIAERTGLPLEGGGTGG